MGGGYALYLVLQASYNGELSSHLASEVNALASSSTLPHSPPLTFCEMCLCSLLLARVHVGQTYWRTAYKLTKLFITSPSPSGEHMTLGVLKGASKLNVLLLLLL